LKITRTTLPEVLLIAPVVYRDERGWFFELFRDERWAEQGLPTNFRQDNQSRSNRGVLRGLHYQLQHAQGKLISCVSGSAFDVAVDIRVGSPTYGKWVGVELSADEPRLLWMPPGFAHGFYARADATVIQYKCTDVYVPWDEHGILWSDPELKIEWPETHPILSPRDRDLPTLRAARNNLPRYGTAFTSEPARTSQ
jgi:dTDP-4-dehydrorhamnose 3,5-epimerase